MLHMYSYNHSLRECHTTKKADKNVLASSRPRSRTTLVRVLSRVSIVLGSSGASPELLIVSELSVVSSAKALRSLSLTRQVISRDFGEQGFRPASPAERRKTV